MMRKSLRIELFCQWLQIADHLMDIRHRRLIHKAKIHYSNAVMVLKKKKKLKKTPLMTDEELSHCSSKE